MILIMLGPPGAGKGTQTALLENRYNFKIISTGNEIREHVKSKTELGVKAKSFMDAGQLVPDDLINDLILYKLRDISKQDNILFDGYPRSINQANVLDNFLQSKQIGVDLVINLDVPDSDLINRITSRYSCAKCNTTYNKIYHNPVKQGVCDKCSSSEFVFRNDDKLETVKVRLETYHQQTKPLLEYYANKKNLQNIDGTVDIQKISENLEFIIKNKANILT